MPQPLTTTARPGTQRPGGRTERNREAVARAALALLARGETELSPGALAAESGVGRSTIHRRWPTRAHVLREALALHTAHITIPDTGAFDTDVRRLASALALYFNDPTEIAMSSAMAAHTDPDFDTWVIDYWHESTAELLAPFERATERGEIEGANAPVLLEMLMGPMVMRTVVLKERLTPAFARDLAEQVIRAARR